MPQLTIDFSHQNTKGNQVILDNNREHFNRQCNLVLAMLEAGCILNTRDALVAGIGDLRARIRDLIKAGVPVKKKLIKGRFKQYYL